MGVVALLFCALSLTKGFFAFVAVPLLFIFLPVIIHTQVTMDSRLEDDTAHPSMARLASVQLASACAFYFSFPMAGDGTPTVVYIIEGAGAALRVLCVVSAVVFVVATVRFHKAAALEK
ncbi:MAG: hypothetical protein M0D55_03625 [Elusimicrobiota bacterium]|nr:MAG: hypothetical protein M0D55_03625 [Elusimicrobiota bacterium]